MLKKNILFLVVVIYLITALLGYQIGWSVFQYDELRLLQLPLALCALFILIFAKKLEYSIHTQINFFIIGVLILTQQINWEIFEFQELWSAIALLFIFSALTYELRNIKNIEHGIALIVVTAIIPCLFILISIFNFISVQQWFDWQFNSGSIRIYDSVIVPLFFLLIFLKNKKVPYIQYLYPLGIFLFALAWLFDGARSALLAVLIGLTSLFIFSKDNRRLVLQTIVYMFVAFAVYKSTVYFADKNTMTVLRTGTSLRAEMWKFVFEQWKQHPFTGVGGGYLSKIQYAYGHHIHNLYLRLIFEWGVIGFIFLIWMLYQLIGLFKDRAVSLVLKAGVIAVLVDAMFSGNMVYPASQIACILFIALAFSQRHHIGDFTSAFSIWSTKVLVGMWGILFLYIAIVHFGQDLSCWNCGSYGGRMAPNFWEYGGAEHLISSDQIP
ncbi:O-antigen ligase family protein [Acinetobacter baumannii]|uniref:O-antigen ligase family protein n=1 Tax=Acinetobacter baumannii TaxID=470 RepID=UPI002446C46C|nr:O-antigen ligase family protein [Acinetobacter baumannii]MDG9795727.1 O-antigen ligase family protein [Acinetobacter baumannii]MDU4060123.1 O-antigen ligase family protein [Acinetobacter baumannii]MDU5496865.1 O-antigen ligase family protein [Acinetobacter baumannii]